MGSRDNSRNTTQNWVWCPSCGFWRRKDQMTYIQEPGGGRRALCEVWRPYADSVLPIAPQIAVKSQTVMVGCHAPEPEPDIIHRGTVNGFDSVDLAGTVHRGAVNEFAFWRVHRTDFAERAVALLIDPFAVLLIAAAGLLIGRMPR
jgi:hypothetical protein